MQHLLLVFKLLSYFYFSHLHFESILFKSGVSQRDPSSGFTQDGLSVLSTVNLLEAKDWAFFSGCSVKIWKLYSLGISPWSKEAQKHRPLGRVVTQDTVLTLSCQQIAMPECQSFLCLKDSASRDQAWVRHMEYFKSIPVRTPRGVPGKCSEDLFLLLFPCFLPLRKGRCAWPQDNKIHYTNLNLAWEKLEPKVRSWAQFLLQS